MAERRLDDYSSDYRHVKFHREDGILQLTLHSDDGPVVWGGDPGEEMSRLWRDVGDDRENLVIILTGTGEWFTGPKADWRNRHFKGVPKPSEWDVGIRRGRFMEMDLLNVDVPIIAAVNGPAYRHCEQALLCDIVLASETALFQDTGHYWGGRLAPGDGMHIALTTLLGINRARYMVFTGQAISAQEAKTLGLVGEILPLAELLPRAWALAREIARQPTLLTRYTKQVMTQHIKQIMQAHVAQGLAYEALADIDRAMREAEQEG
jgi:enoyl-CoA hydratase/carnithine racemase